MQVITTGGNGLVTGPFSTSTAQDALDFPGVGNTFFGRTDQRSDHTICRLRRGDLEDHRRVERRGGVRYFTETLNGVQTQTHPFGGFPGAPTLVPISIPRRPSTRSPGRSTSATSSARSLLAYGTVSTGFRSGGLNARQRTFEPIPAAYSPDSLTNYEVGRQRQAVRRRARLSGRRLLIHWDNIQVQETTADGAFIYQGNAGNARVKGVEFEFNGHPFAVSRRPASPALTRMPISRGRHGGAIRAESDPGADRAIHPQRTQVPAQLRTQLHARRSSGRVGRGWSRPTSPIGMRRTPISRPISNSIFRWPPTRCVNLRAGVSTVRGRHGLCPQSDRQTCASFRDQFFAGSGRTADGTTADRRPDRDAQVLAVKEGACAGSS